MDAKILNKDGSYSVSLSLELKSANQLKSSAAQIKSDLTQVGEALGILTLNEQTPSNPGSQLQVERFTTSKKEFSKPLYQDSIAKLNEILEIMGDGETAEPSEIVAEVRRQLSVISRIENKLAQLLSASNELRKLSNSSLEKKIGKLLADVVSKLESSSSLSKALEEFSRALPESNAELPQSTTQLLHYLVQLRKLSKSARQSLRSMRTSNWSKVRSSRLALVNFEKGVGPIMKELLESAVNAKDYGQNIFIRSFLQGHEAGQIAAGYNRKDQQLVQKILQKLDAHFSEQGAAEENAASPQATDELTQHQIATKLNSRESGRGQRRRGASGKQSRASKNSNNHNLTKKAAINPDGNKQSSQQHHSELETKATQDEKLNEFVNLALHCMITKTLEIDDDGKRAINNEAPYKKNALTKKTHSIEFSINMENLGLLAVYMISEDSRIDLKFASENRSIVSFIEKRLYRISTALRAVGFETIDCVSNQGSPKVPKGNKLGSHAIA